MNLQRVVRRRVRWRPYTRPFGYISFYKTASNLFMTVNEPDGNMLHNTSLGVFNMKGKKGRQDTESTEIGARLAGFLHPLGLHRIDIRCYTGLREVRRVLWALNKHGIKVRRIFDFNRIPHGKVRLKSRRRIKRRKR
jgi:ribosomal protein S11